MAYTLAQDFPFHRSDTLQLSAVIGAANTYWYPLGQKFYDAIFHHLFLCWSLIAAVIKKWISIKEYVYARPKEVLFLYFPKHGALMHARSARGLLYRSVDKKMGFLPYVTIEWITKVYHNNNNGPGPPLQWKPINNRTCTSGTMAGTWSRAGFTERVIMLTNQRNIVHRLSPSKLNAYIHFT